MISLARQPTRVLGLAVVVGAAVSISISNVLAPIVYAAGSNPSTLIVFRFACFLAVSGLWLRLAGVGFAVDRETLIACIVSGAFYIVGSGGLLAAFSFIPVSLAVLLFYTYPLMTRLIESTIDRRMPGLWEILVLFMAFAGLGLALGTGISNLNGLGLAFALVAALGISSSFVWTGRRLPDIPASQVTFYMAVTGFFLILLYSFVTQSFAPPGTSSVDLSITALASISFAAAFLGMFAGVQLIGAPATSMVMNLEPVLTIALALLILGESLTVYQLIGALLVLAAVFGWQIFVNPEPRSA